MQMMLLMLMMLMLMMLMMMGKKEEKEEKKEKERGNVKEGGLLDWLLEQQERKATLAAACAKDPRWGKYI